MCNVSQTFDCDTVSASKYSSFAGIPLSIWGGATNLALGFLLVVGWLGWAEKPERQRRWSLVLALLSVTASIAMGLVSTLWLRNYCLFCLGLYGLSAVIAIALWGVVREPIWPGIKSDFMTLTTESRGILLVLLAIPVMAWLTHRMFLQNFGGERLEQLVRQSVMDWQASSPVEFVAQPLLSTGASRDSARLRISEFADFSCGHCKRASYSLHAFTKAHPDVRFEFYTFPLDGKCNEEFDPGDGVRCNLAAAVVCAERNQMGWQMHDLLFDEQERLMHVYSVEQIQQELSKLATGIGLNIEAFTACLNDPTAMETVRAQAKQGALVNVRGTPTIFANSKLLNMGQTLPVLEAVRNSLESASQP